MLLSNILLLIDSEIQLLLTVRSLLSDEETPSRQPKARRPMRRPIDESEGAPAPLLLEPVDAPVAAVPVAPKQRRVRAARTQTLRKKRDRVPAEPRALATAIPARPVAVSAAAVAQRRETVSREMTARASQHEAAGDEGTLDALLRQLQGRAVVAA